MIGQPEQEPLLVWSLRITNQPQKFQSTAKANFEV